jgi:hypothetical protein
VAIYIPNTLVDLLNWMSSVTGGANLYS